MGAAQSEIHKLLARCREHYPSGLRRDDRLEMQQVEQSRLNELRLRQWSRHPQHRFVGEEHGALRHRVHVTGETQHGEAVDELRGEAA
jgi:hypothetical protein